MQPNLRLLGWASEALQSLLPAGAKARGLCPQLCGSVPFPGTDLHPPCYCPAQSRCHIPCVPAASTHPHTTRDILNLRFFLEAFLTSVHCFLLNHKCNKLFFSSERIFRHTERPRNVTLNPEPPTFLNCCNSIFFTLKGII